MQLTVGEFWALKHVLARFMQDRRVKVSLFLQGGLQNMDGTMVISRNGPVPLGSDPPGCIRCAQHRFLTVCCADRDVLPCVDRLAVLCTPFVSFRFHVKCSLLTVLRVRLFDTTGVVLRTVGVPRIAVHGAENSTDAQCRLGLNLYVPSLVCLFLQLLIVLTLIE